MSEELDTTGNLETSSDLNSDPQDTSAIKVVLSKIAKKQPIVSKYERYYRGFHPLNFGSEKFSTEFADRLKKFRDNLCKTCVQAPADRLEIIGFSADSNSDVYKTSWDIWKRSQMPLFSKEVHRSGFKTGDGYLVVWQDADGKARLWKQEPANCTVVYDDETNTVDYGGKVWRGTDRFVYLTMYFRDRVEKYISKNPQSVGHLPSTAAAFKPRKVEGEDWPLMNETGKCPIFHFGRESSILDDVMPLNDALNKQICDMLISSESNSMVQRWVTGIAYEINPETGKQIIPFEDFATWTAANDATAKFGQFQEIDIKNFLEAIKDMRNEIASVAGIPPYYFRLEGGSMPSGEALRKAESRFTAIVKDSQLSFGEPWAQAMSLAMEIDGIGTGDGPGSKLETQWSPADPMSDNEKADLMEKKKRVGISTKQALSELGYTDADITRMDGESNAEAKAKAEAFQTSFDAGKPFG